jgi:hypothetical protein
MACICASTLERWELASGTPNQRIDPATAAEILRGCDLASTTSVTPHHHYSEERIDDSKYVCRTCGSVWKDRVFSSAEDGSNPRSYFTPWR